MEIITAPFEKPIEIILNGEMITVTAFETDERGKIKLGIKAPHSIKVNREEIYRAIQEKQQQAKI